MLIEVGFIGCDDLNAKLSYEGHHGILITGETSDVPLQYI